jgi:hypothetical protein
MRFDVIFGLRQASERPTLFRAWGRLGTRQGDTRSAKMTLTQAKAEFERHFLEKTGNEWADRGSFRKKPRCFDLVDVAYDDAGSARALQGPRAAGGGGSRLPEEVQALVKALFDVQVGPGPARASPAPRAAVPSTYRQADM